MDPVARGLTVWTLGHAHHEFDHYVGLLQASDIELVIDVRSIPVIRFAPWYNRAALEPALVSRGIDYEYLGDELGGRPSGDEFYDSEGHTLYQPLSSLQSFKDGVAAVEERARGRKVALTCLEEEPERCHRYPLIGEVLTRHGAEVLHIRRDGKLETQQEVDQRLGVTQGSLFGGGVWRSPLPMKEGHNRG